MAQRKGKWSELSPYTQGRYRRKGVTPEQYNAGKSIYQGESKQRREAKIAKEATKQAPHQKPTETPPKPKPQQGKTIPGIWPPEGHSINWEYRVLFRQGTLREIVNEQTEFIQGFLRAVNFVHEDMITGCSEVRIKPLEETFVTKKGLTIEPGKNRWQVEQDIWWYSD